MNLKALGWMLCLLTNCSVSEHIAPHLTQTVPDNPHFLEASDMPGANPDSEFLCLCPRTYPANSGSRWEPACSVLEYLKKKIWPRNRFTEGYVMK